MISHCIFCAVAYILASITEWFFHKNCMHHTDTKTPLPGKVLQGLNKRHVIHHSVTNTDMTVRNSKSKYEEKGLEDYMHLEEFDGLYFLWPPTITMWIIGIMGGPMINYILHILLSSTNLLSYNVSSRFSVGVGFFLTSWITIIWNWLHPQLHKARRLSLSEGLDVLPRWEWMKDTFLYNYLWKHHVLHHFLAGNYNVTLPGADWLFDTNYTECKRFKLDVKNKTISKV